VKLDCILTTACLLLFQILKQNAKGDRAVEMALSNPETYVMKPQREGGGKVFNILNLY